MADERGTQESLQPVGFEGTSIRSVAQFITGVEDPSQKQVEKAFEAQGFRKRDVRRMGRAWGRLKDTPERDFLLRGDGTFDVVQNNQALTGSGKGKGNKRGFDVGDLIGLGRDASLLAGGFESNLERFQQKQAFDSAADELEKEARFEKQVAEMVDLFKPEEEIADELPEDQVAAIRDRIDTKNTPPADVPETPAKTTKETTTKEKPVVRSGFIEGEGVTAEEFLRGTTKTETKEEPETRGFIETQVDDLFAPQKEALGLGQAFFQDMRDLLFNDVSAEPRTLFGEMFRKSFIDDEEEFKKGGKMRRYGKGGKTKFSK